MRQHILAFGATVDASGGDVQLVAIPEQAFNIDGSNNFLIPSPLKVFAAYAGGVGLTRARFRTGSLLSRGLPQIFPLNLTVLPPTPVNVADMRYYAPNLRAEESLRTEITNAASVDSVACLFVTPDTVEENINVPELRWLRATVTLTGVKFAWSAPGALAFQDTLEGGKYDVYGLAVRGATTIAARLVFQNGFYRPGCLGQAIDTQVPSYMFNAKSGKWDSFSTYSPPQLEILASAAGSQAQQVWVLAGKSAA